ncbi:TonB-dependent receptor domain-containing protein [Pseudomonas aeruginosa]|uniref:TonB-dependent receptor domain-containing protein n=1 Tax=Pseudomonas aeruginosa TaxID=287 RepID=UPI0032AF25AE
MPGSRFAPALRRLLRRHRPADRRRWPADGRRLQVQEHPAQPRRQPQWAGATVRPDPRTARWVTYAQGETRQDTARFLNLPNTPVNVYRWDPHGVPRPQIGSTLRRAPRTTTQKGLYALGRIKLAEPLTLVVGGRESWWDQDTPATRFKPGRQFTPYGGLIWDFARDWSWYVSYAEVYQPQADRQTWNSEPLSPVEGRDLRKPGSRGRTGRRPPEPVAGGVPHRPGEQSAEDPDHPGHAQQSVLHQRRQGAQPGLRAGRHRAT